MNFIDTHTHLYADEFNEDRDDMIKRAQSFGINKFMLPNIDSGSVEGMFSLVTKYPGLCYPMMGLHPCSVKENYKEELKLVADYLSNRHDFVAVGEIGIDLYWDKTFLTQQQEAFQFQVELALKYKLPIVIHCREAFDEIYTELKMFSKLPKGIFHCFSGTLEQANKILALGDFKLGIGGVLTFKNSGLDKVVEQIDLSHLVLETDSPYLAPIPFRGKRNESAYMIHVAEKLALLKNESLETVAKITSQNAEEIFEKGN